MMPIVTADGTPSFYSRTFQEPFHSTCGALRETRETFIAMARLDGWPRGHRLRVIDCCTGLGYNAAALWEAVQQQRPDLELRWLGLELNPGTLAAALAQDRFRELWSPVSQRRLALLATVGRWQQAGQRGQMLWGDARQHLRWLGAWRGQVDLVLHDPFSPPRCPMLWSVEVLRIFAALLSPAGRLVTYSRAAAVRQALLTANLQLGSIPPSGERQPRRWSAGTIASPGDCGLPLSTLELEHLHTCAAVPYRDPTLQDDTATILERRRQEQACCNRESTSAWRRRWQL